MDPCRGCGGLILFSCLIIRISAIPNEHFFISTLEHIVAEDGILHLSKCENASDIRSWEIAVRNKEMDNFQCEMYNTLKLCPLPNQPAVKEYIETLMFDAFEQCSDDFWVFLWVILKCISNVCACIFLNTFRILGIIMIIGFIGGEIYDLSSRRN